MAITYKNITRPNQFADMVLPQFELFNYELNEIENLALKGKKEEVVSRELNFNIKIDVSKIANSFIALLSEELKEAFAMNWAPYNRIDKTYNFYTRSYGTTLDQRKQRLEEIFSTLKDFEVLYKEKIKNNIPVFETAKRELPDFETPEFVVKFSPQLETFVVLAKSYIGSDVYKRFASCSQKIGKTNEDESLAEIFPDKKFNKKTVFVINKNEYVILDELFKQIKKKNDNFLEEQENFLKSNGLEQKAKEIEVTYENAFNFKILINEERKCFEFFCNGYETTYSHYTGRNSKRNTIGNWALNFIYSAPQAGLPEDYKVTEDYLLREDYFRVKVPFQADSSKKNKTYYVPFTEFKYIQMFHDNFKRENEFWSRPQSVIKHPMQTLELYNSHGANLDRFPSIFLGDKGQAYFIFEHKVTSSKKSMATITALKGFKITFEEYDHFMNHHLMKDVIKENTIFLNSQMYAGLRAGHPREDVLSAFEDVAMAYRLNNQVKEQKVQKKLKL